MISLLTDARRRRGKVTATEPRTEEGSALDVQTLPAQISSQMVQLFKLLADETRLQILYFLTQRAELNVGTLCQLLQQSQPAVSHHLALMRTAGFIEMRRDGKHNFYRIQPSRFQEIGHVVYGVLPAEARAWQWNGVAVAPASGASAVASTPIITGTSGA